MPDNISKVTQLKEKDGTLLFPLTSALTKLDFANEVDLTSRNTDYTAPADGVLITDSGAVQINKGEIIRNNGANTKFIPLRNVTYLPDEVTATDIPAVHDGANTNVQAAITDIDSDISSINTSLEKFSIKSIQVTSSTGRFEIPANGATKCIAVIESENEYCVSRVLKSTIGDRFIVVVTNVSTGEIPSASLTLRFWYIAN